MNNYIKKGLIVMAVTGMSIGGSASLMAQSYLDGSSKARGDYNYNSSSRSRYDYRSSRCGCCQEMTSASKPVQPQEPAKTQPQQQPTK